MTLLLVALAVVVALVLLLWPRLIGEPDQFIEQATPPSTEERLVELNHAYQVALTELGREPTNDEILMTRDFMRELDDA